MIVFIGSFLLKSYHNVTTGMTDRQVD